MLHISYTIKDQVYQYLKASIVSGEYAMGEQLKEVEIAEKLKVSRTPVREVIMQLVADGLLINVVNKGVFVRQFTHTDVRDIINVRRMFEHRGFQSLIDGGQPNTKNIKKIQRNLLASYQSGNQAGYSSADFELHKEIVSYNQNPYINDFHTRLHNIIQMLRNIALESPERFQDSYVEHTEIIEHILSGDYEQAWEVDKQHLINTGDEIIKFLRSSPE